MVEKEEAALAAQAETFIGSFVSLITNSNIKYQGVIFYLNAKDSTIGIRIQKQGQSSGTEGQRNDGLPVPPSEEIYEYLYFKGTEIKDVSVKSPRPAQTTSYVLDDPAIIQVLDVNSPHPVQSTHNVLDDPAIIQFHSSLPASSSVSLSSSGALQMTNVSHNEQSAVNVPYRQGNHAMHSSIARPLGSSLPPLTLNKSTPRSPGVQNAHSATNSANVVELEPLHSFIPPISPGVQNVFHESRKSPVFSSSGIHSMTATSARGPQNRFPPISPGVQKGLFLVPQMSPIGSRSSTTPLLDTGTASVEEVDTSVCGPVAPSSSMLPSVKPTAETHSSFFENDPMQPSDLLLQQEKIRLSSYPNDYGPVQVSASATLSSGSKNVREPQQQIVKPQANKQPISPTISGRRRGLMQGATASSQYDKTYHSQRPNDEPNGAGLHDQYGYKAHAEARGHEKGRDGFLGAYSPHGYERGRDYLALRPAEKFTEDFNFEAMNKKFNKEEVWGLLGESSSASAAEHKNLDGTDTNIGGAPEAKEDGPVKVDNTPVYCKDDFFDTLSSNTLDQQAGRWRVKFSERKKLDIETFGEIPIHQQGRGILGPPPAGKFQGSHWGRGRGRGYFHSRRGRGRSV